MQKTEQTQQSKCSVVMQLLSASGTSEYHRAVTGTRAIDLPLSERKMSVIGTGRSVPGLHFSFTQPHKAGVKIRSACHNTEAAFVHRAENALSMFVLCFGTLKHLQDPQLDMLETSNRMTYSFG